MRLAFLAPSAHEILDFPRQALETRLGYLRIVGDERAGLIQAVAGLNARVRCVQGIDRPRRPRLRGWLRQYVAGLPRVVGRERCPRLASSGEGRGHCGGGPERGRRAGVFRCKVQTMVVIIKYRSTAPAVVPESCDT